MPKLSGTRDGHVTALPPIPTADGDLHVRAVLERLTGADDRAMVAAAAEGAAAVTEQTYAHLLKVLVDWDLEDDNGDTLPVTVENLEALPNTIILAITMAVGEAMRPPENGRPSANGS